MNNGEDVEESGGGWENLFYNQWGAKNESEERWLKAAQTTGADGNYFYIFRHLACEVH